MLETILTMVRSSSGSLIWIPESIYVGSATTQLNRTADMSNIIETAIAIACFWHYC